MSSRTRKVAAVTALRFSTPYAVSEGVERKNSAPRILVVTHSHPALTRGGAEISADALFRALRAQGAPCWLLGCAPPHEGRLGNILTERFGTDNFLYTPGAPFDYFKFANRDPRFPEYFCDLLRETRPDIVHAHHYSHVGVEIFALIRRVLPHARIVLSLHEYLAICHNNGQMVKTATALPCARATPADCARCFPQFTPADFFLREGYIRNFFDLVDLFLTPSAFLAQRYVEWGLPRAKIMVLENMPLGTDGASAGSRFAADTLCAAAAPGPRTITFGFFGQLSPLKGIDVVMQAARELDAMGVRHVRIEIHGDTRNQPTPLQEAAERSLREAGGNVHVRGPYANSDVCRLMRAVDAVLVPSVWWENSPVVIQEALRAGRPVLCSDIGGMAEKVRDGLDGLHFRMGDARHLATIMAGLAAEPSALDRLRETLAKPWDGATALAAHLAAYRRVMTQSPAT